jgi:hypothetical protein
MWVNDRKHAITGYARTHWHEDFAEAHRLYLTNPDLLHELSPERFKLVNDCYKRMLVSSRRVALVTKFKVLKSKREANLALLLA